MRMLITIPDLALDSGGTVTGAVNSAEQLTTLGCATAIAWVRDAREEKLPKPPVQCFPIEPARSRLLRGIQYIRGFADAVRVFKPDVVYDWGIWLPQNVASFLATRMHGVPWINAPTGMLEPWSLLQNASKKKLAWHIYQKPILRHARALIAPSRQEAFNLKILLPDALIRVVPLGVDMPTTQRSARQRAVRQAVFMSRLHPKKQADLLIRVWRKLDPAGWRLVIAGPGEPDYRQQLEQLAAAPGVHSQITILPAVIGTQKSALLFNSDVFVLPTFSENFGIAIAEALAHGLPVITTNTTPWSRLLEQRCGWFIDPSAEALEQALSEAMTMDAESLEEMGLRSQKLAQEYSWPSVTRLLLHECEQLLLNRGDSS